MSKPQFAELVEIQPPLGDRLRRFMLERFGATLTLRSSIPPERLTVQMWTNIPSKYNSEGDWYAIDLPYHFTLDGVHHFEGAFFPTSQGEYAYTYRIGDRQQPGLWQWLGYPHNDGFLSVQEPSDLMPWAQGPSCIRIISNLYIGNYIAASQADKLGVDAVLNMAEELALSYPPQAKITYQKLGTPDGAENTISDDILVKSVNWLDEQRAAGRHKIMVNCRAGIGRSGSVMVAYCFAKHPTWTYVETVEYVWSRKPNIYPHRHLQQSLERLFPRQ